jgi:hypothetical protein
MPGARQRPSGEPDVACPATPVVPDRDGANHNSAACHQQAPNARLVAGVLGARSSKGPQLIDIRKSLGLATMAGALVMAPLALGTGTANADDGVNWDAVASCESGGNWHTATGNGYYGGLQFTMSTWRSNGGSGSPHQASREEQIRVADNVLKSQGIGAWPVCGRRG